MRLSSLGTSAAASLAFFFFFNDTATTEIYTLSLHDALPISPYSLTTTAVPAPSGLSSSARINVVLPEPRKPVTTTTGSRGPRGRFRRRPKGSASVPAKGAPGPRSEVHLKRVEPSDMAVDGINDGALVDEHVVYLDRPGRRAFGR